MARFLSTLLAALERWYLRAPLRFAGLAVACGVAWPVAVTAVASTLRVERVVEPVLVGATPAEFALRALLLAPLLENALLWVVFRAALFCAVQWLPRGANGAAVGLTVVAFSLAHWSHKVMLGAEMLATAWFMTMCLLWGQRHAQPLRGFALSIVIHFGVNAVASTLRFIGS
jgi:hypothetical protein